MRIEPFFGNSKEELKTRKQENKLRDEQKAPERCVGQADKDEKAKNTVKEKDPVKTTQ